MTTGEGTKMRNLLTVYAKNVTFVADKSQATFTDDFEKHWDTLPGWVKDRYVTMGMMGMMAGASR